MAGDWIKMRTNLCGDPGVKAISRTLKLDTFSVVGRLHEFWAWADQHTDDGVLEFTVMEDIDDVVQKRGFASELVRVGWLIDNGLDGVEIPKWDRHNGDSAKKRCQAQERMGRMRKRMNDESVTLRALHERNNCNDSVTLEASQTRNQRREEKRRVQNTPLSGTESSGANGDSEQASEQAAESEIPQTGMETNEEWLARIKRLHAAIDVDGEIVRLRQIAAGDGSAVTRRRVESWLKKASPAVAGSVLSDASEKAAADGPEGWRDIIAQNCPDYNCPAEWRDVFPTIRDAVIEVAKKAEKSKNKKEGAAE